MSCIMSSSKTVASILISIMISEGKVCYNDTVAKHWPAFAQNGKQDIKISDVMRHEAGLHRLWRKVKPEESHLQNIK